MVGISENNEETIGEVEAETDVQVPMHVHIERAVHAEAKARQAEIEADVRPEVVLAAEGEVPLDAGVRGIRNLTQIGVDLMSEVLVQVREEVDIVLLRRTAMAVE